MAGEPGADGSSGGRLGSSMRRVPSLESLNSAGSPALGGRMSDVENLMDEWRRDGGGDGSMVDLAGLPDFDLSYSTAWSQDYVPRNIPAVNAGAAAPQQVLLSGEELALNAIEARASEMATRAAAAAAATASAAPSASAPASGTVYAHMTGGVAAAVAETTGAVQARSQRMAAPSAAAAPAAPAAVPRGRGRATGRRPRKAAAVSAPVEGRTKSAARPAGGRQPAIPTAGRIGVRDPSARRAGAARGRGQLGADGRPARPPYDADRSEYTELKLNPEGEWICPKCNQELCEPERTTSRGSKGRHFKLKHKGPTCVDGRPSSDVLVELCLYCGEVKVAKIGTGGSTLYRHEDACHQKWINGQLCQTPRLKLEGSASSAGAAVAAQPTASAPQVPAPPAPSNSQRRSLSQAAAILAATQTAAPGSGSVPRMNPVEQIKIQRRNTVFFSHCSSGQITVMKATVAGLSEAEIGQLLRYKKEPPSSTSKIGFTPLHAAASGGHPKSVQFLLSLGADVSAGSADLDFTPLHAAARSGNSEVIKILLDAGADPNRRTRLYEWTPLQVAIDANNVDAVQFFVQHEKARGGDPINTPCTYGSTPLLDAAASDAVDVLKYLIDAGADLYAINVRTRDTALARAAVNGRHLVIPILIDADLKKGGGSARRLLIQRANHNGQTCLIQAVSTARVDTVEVLLNIAKSGKLGKHFDLHKWVNQTEDYAGFSALHYAAGESETEADADRLVQLLLEAGANVDLKNKQRDSPLFNAILAGNDKVVKRLLDKGASVRVTGAEGLTPLNYALSLGASPLVVTHLRDALARAPPVDHATPRASPEPAIASAAAAEVAHTDGAAPAAAVLEAERRERTDEELPPAKHSRISLRGLGEANVDEF